MLAFSHQVIHSQEVRVETQIEACAAEALFPSEVKDLQTEVQDTLRTLQLQEQDSAGPVLDDDKVHEVIFQFCVFVPI